MSSSTVFDIDITDLKSPSKSASAMQRLMTYPKMDHLKLSQAMSDKQQVAKLRREATFQCFK